jgi:hypothetical protein
MTHIPHVSFSIIIFFTLLQLEEKKISFVRYAMGLTDIYSVTLKVSKTGRLVLIASGVQK